LIHDLLHTTQEEYENMVISHHIYRLAKEAGEVSLARLFFDQK